MQSYKRKINRLKNIKSTKDFFSLFNEFLRMNSVGLRRSIFKSNQPDFLIIGAQKAGTSSLHYYLNQHPKLVGSIPKEIHYFDKWMKMGFDIDWYEKNFNSLVPENRLFFESSPNYIYYEEIARQISSYYPDIKLILILRDPVKRAFSAWNMYRTIYIYNKKFYSEKERHPGSPNLFHKYFYENRDTFPDFMEAIKIENTIAEKNRDREPSILRRGLYAQQIKSYYNYFNKNQLLIIGFNELVFEARNTLKKVHEFLEVPKIPFSKINSEPRNKKSYERNISRNEINFLEDYYRKPNEELWSLLGRKLNW